jgi:LmbE family N-acetylglucosaminyl deacetylase
MTSKFSLLAAYGHPDDEQGVSGLMHKYANDGVNVTLVCATRGEVGEIAPGVNATPQTLGQVREEELRCAAEKIGLSNLYFLDYRDSGMIGTPPNNDPRCLWQANLLEVVEKLVRLVRRHKPHVMLTFDPNGGYGHPDHIKIHQATMIAYFVAGDARVFPEQISKEGLLPWAPLKLYWGAFARSRFEVFAKMAEKSGTPLPEQFNQILKRSMPDEVITTRVNVAELVDLKLNALFCHASQMDPNSMWSKIPERIRKEGMKTETLIRVESRIEPIEGVEDDLFAGVE